MKVIKIIFSVLLLFFCMEMQAQNTYTKQTEEYAVSENVSVNLNLRHTQLEVETWNRDEVQLEAYLSAKDISEATLKEMAKNWKLEVLGNSNTIKILSKVSIAPPLPQFASSKNQTTAVDLRSLNTDFIAPMLEDLKPMLENLPSIDLPSDYMENLSVLRFDYDAFKKEGQAYLQNYEEQIKKSFGKDFEEAMQEWTKNLEARAEIQAKRFQERIEANQERMQSIKQRQENHAARWEAFAERMEEMAGRMRKDNGGNYSKTVTTGPNGSKSVQIIYSNSPANTKKENGVDYVLRLKIPKDVQLLLNSRYGKVNLSDAVSNLKAQISYSNFTAEELNGENTELRIAYSPVKIKHWEYGKLWVDYVKDASIQNVKSIQLQAKGSNFFIEKLEETGLIQGSFGSFKIGEIAKDFKQLHIELASSDAVVKLPETAFNFNYNGKQSAISYPKNLNPQVTDNYGTKVINGFKNSRNTDKNVQIIAKYSNVSFK
ncbi:hypothetical protein [Haloflavibacter putidus]|uniref:DUF4139 domain-containing protein n=1 Tax=Haloflavibacter putidus TaxID=2576776 RepID=A0A507ZPU3_9FLAO|nr:hypothetical protein [Haloflavibacter putidus]TQD37768.1 hypothetical protein FKR84_09865 [Haloflavibacter putidus]